MQCDGVDYKMALVTDRSRYILLKHTLDVHHGHIADLKLGKWNCICLELNNGQETDTFAKVTQFMPE